MKKKLMALGMAAVLALEYYQERGGHVRAAAEPMQKRMIRLWRILTLFWTGIPMRFTPSCM